MAKELLSKPDGFITITANRTQYIPTDIQRISTHANLDDTVTHWTINTKDGGQGNIQR